MEGSRTKKSIRNIIFGIGNKFIYLLLQFLSRTVFIKILGAEYLGINGLFTNVLTLLSLADLGISSAMVYSFYKPLAQNDKNKLAALTTFYKKIYNCIAMTVAIVGLILVPFIHIIVNTDSDIPNLELYYVLFLANTVMSYLFVYKSSIIEADQKAYIISRYKLINTVISTILQIVLLIITHNYILYLLIQIFCTLLNNVLIARKSGKLYPFIQEKVDLDQKEKKDIFQNIKAVFIYKFSSVLLNGTDNIIISKMIGTVWVGLYSNYLMVINAINTFINTIFNSMYASIGNLVVTSNYKRKKEVFNIISFVGFFIATFTTTCLIILLEDFITLWIGTDYILKTSILIAIIFNHYLSCVLQPIWSYREATGMFKKTKYIMLVCAIENIVLSIILGKILGIAGILVASSISRLSTYFWYEPIILFKDFFNSSSRLYFWKQLKNIILTVFCIIITIGLTSFIKDVSIINWIIKAIIAMIVPTVIYFLLYRKSDEYKYLYNNIISKVIKKMHIKIK